MSRFLFALVGLLMAVLPVAAQSGVASAPVSAPHVTVQLFGRQAAASPSGTLGVGLFFKIEPSWHVYWKNAGDAGEPPKIDWVLPQGVTAGPLQFAAPKRLPLGPLMDYGYEGEVLFPAEIKLDGSLKPGATLPLVAHVSWLVCQERCLPGKADLKLNVPVAAASSPADSQTLALFQRFEALLPQPLPVSAKAIFQPAGEGFRLQVITGQSESQAVFFPEDEDAIDNPAPQKLTATVDGFILDLKKGPYLTTQPTQLKGVVELAGGRNYEFTAAAGTVSATPVFAAGGKASGKILRTAAFAFLGGLILNLMPCVFPVLFLKGLALVNSGNEERRALRLHGLVYTLGILCSFWVLVAVLLGLRAAGSTLGWGFQFQSPVFLALMAGLLFFLGLSLAGQFEIGLSLTSAGGELAQKQGFAGSFFTGVLAVVVATPCTAPFMGAAVGYALSASPVVTFAVFTALALGLAAPYLALTLQPAWTRLLPRPGVWMDYLKQAVSLPIFATVIWLLWVLAGSYGASLLATLLSGLLLLAVAGWFLGRWPAKRWATLVATLILLAVVALDALAPRRFVAEPQSPAETGHSATQPWSAAAVARAQAAGQPVFVDFTASWCLSCQVNERVALSQPEVREAFAAHNVLVLKADWTRHDEAITTALTGLGRSGVPAYALYVPGESSPRLLPEVLTPGVVLEALGKLPQK